MSGDVLLFWLIHLFLGVVVPVLALTGCCRREEEKAAEQGAETAPEFIF